jgi:hypothetical protein
VHKIADNLLRQTKQLRNIAQPKEQTTTQLKRTLISEAQPIQQLPSIPTLILPRSSSQPSFKGKICRGVNYDPGSLSIFTKAKIKEL